MEHRLVTKNYNQSSQGASYTAQQELKNKIERARIDIERIDSKLKEPIPSVSEMPADYHYLYGNILFKFKRFADSFNSYLEAVRVNPCHVNALNNLANLKFMARKYKDALAYLEKAEQCGGKVNLKFREAILKAMGK
jgi:tetratricopeptide (TPR) repeat protein